jgi:hypothetical protein
MRLATLLLVLNMVWIASDRSGRSSSTSPELRAPIAEYAEVIVPPTIIVPPIIDSTMVFAPPETHDRINQFPVSALDQLLSELVARWFGLRS